MKRFALLAAALLLLSVSFAGLAEETVIMNIPYTQFYAAELDLPADYQVDTVTSATEKIFQNAALVSSAYSVETEDGTHEILGLAFPVRVADASLLADLPQADSAEALAHSPSYAYMIPETAPDYYKTLELSDGAYSFGRIENMPSKQAEGVTPVLEEIKGRRGDYKINLKGFDFTVDGKDSLVYGVVVKTADAAYPLRHLENIFSGNELAINAGSSKMIKGVNPAKPDNYTSIVGQTITEIDYYTTDGLYTFDADINLPDNLDNKGYVLMNIPYDRFYEAEVTDASSLDAVSSSTLMKTRTGTLSGGSYHVDPEGSDVSGVIYPVYVDDLSALPSLGGIEITDDASVSITVTNRGEEATTVYSGKDALYQAPSYSWYVMKEGSLPKQYKCITMGDVPTFSTINKKDKALSASAAFIYDRHADVVISVTGAEEKLDATDISGVVLVTEDGTRVGLRHLRNLWRKYQLGFALDSQEYASLKGKTITQIRYITIGQNYVIDVSLPVAEDELLIRLGGTYIELFPEFAREDLKDFWLENIKAYDVDDETAEGFYVALTQGFLGTLMGQEAVEAYSNDPLSMVFDCFFESGISKITFSGNIISGTDADGNEIFRHAYQYVEDQPVTFFGETQDAALRLYKTEDEDAGKFTWFALNYDTPAETQHIEFRYAETADDIANYSEGSCAYWLAAGILDGYKDSMIQDCIKLFISENVGGEE